MVAVKVYSGDDALRRLDSLGIQLDWVGNAIRAGVDAGRTATPDEPGSAAGLKSWLAQVGALRSQLRLEAGWTLLNRLNMPLVVNPAKTIALGVMLGDKNTGSRCGGEPASKYAKGSAFEKITRGNDTLPLLTRAQVGGPGQLEDDQLAALQVWFLVTYSVSLGGNQHVYREVSLPEPSTDGDKVTSWIERIVLPPMDDLGPVVLPRDGRPDDLRGADVAVELW